MDIPLPNGLVAVVDDADAELVNGIRWRACKKPPAKTWYVVADINGKRWSLHQWLCRDNGWPKIDHKDRNGLNNSRSNLRPCTQAQNAANSSLNSTNKSGFKGVHYCKRERRWRAQLHTNGKAYDIGYFRSILDAARAYDAAAFAKYGEFHNPNIPTSASS